nr:receptor-like protein kinase FERONIA [Tanacetum cinerariifolium]
MPVNKTPIVYTVETPNYTAPVQVYATQRNMGEYSQTFNLSWMLPVDSGFYYMLRLHFCNIIREYTKKGQTVFRIFINNKTAEAESDLFYWTQGIVASNEAFKLSMNGNLSSPNPKLSSSVYQPPSPVSPIKENNKMNPHYVMIIGGVGGDKEVELQNQNDRVEQSGCSTKEEKALAVMKKPAKSASRFSFHEGLFQTQLLSYKGLTYITALQFANNVIPPSGCNCKGSCTDPKSCACASLNEVDLCSS